MLHIWDCLLPKLDCNRHKTDKSVFEIVYLENNQFTGSICRKKPLKPTYQDKGLLRKSRTFFTISLGLLLYSLRFTLEWKLAADCSKQQATYRNPYRALAATGSWVHILQCDQDAPKQSSSDSVFSARSKPSPPPFDMFVISLLLYTSWCMSSTHSYLGVFFRMWGNHPYKDFKVHTKKKRGRVY